MSHINIKDLTFEPFLSSETIQERIKEMATAIQKETEGQNPIFVCILNGSFRFGNDLFKLIEGYAEITFVKLASYSGTSSTGKVLTLLGLDVELYDRTVVIVEDIIDTGRTMSEFLPQLYKKGPNKVIIASLLVKPDALEHELDIDHTGFEIENKFVVGYGLDYDGLGRNLDAIYQLKK